MCCSGWGAVLRTPTLRDVALGIGVRPHRLLVEAEALVHGGYLLLWSPEG